MGLPNGNGGGAPSTSGGGLNLNSPIPNPRSPGGLGYDANVQGGATPVGAAVGGAGNAGVPGNGGAMDPNQQGGYNPYGTGYQRQNPQVGAAAQGVQQYFAQHGQQDALSPKTQGIQQMLNMGMTQDQINQALWQTTGGQGYSGFLHGDDRAAAAQAARGGGFYDPRTTSRADVTARNPNALVGKQLMQYNQAHGTQRGAFDNSPLLPTQGLTPGVSNGGASGATRTSSGDTPYTPGVTPRGTVGVAPGDPRGAGMTVANPPRRNPYGSGNMR